MRRRDLYRGQRRAPSAVRASSIAADAAERANRRFRSNFPPITVKGEDLIIAFAHTHGQVSGFVKLHRRQHNFQNRRPRSVARAQRLAPNRTRSLRPSNYFQACEGWGYHPITWLNANTTGTDGSLHHLRRRRKSSIPRCCRLRTSFADRVGSGGVMLSHL